MAKSEPFSMRLSPDVGAMVSEEAARTRRSKVAVIEALADEALRARRFLEVWQAAFPHIPVVTVSAD